MSKRIPDLPADRLVFFSDAVVAIAMTLLVLPLVDLVPEAVRTGEPAVDVVTHNLSALGSFLLSFVVIWRFWTVHHRLFADTDEIGPAVIRLNVVWLLGIVVLPFPTEMVGSYPGEGFVPALYVGVLVVCSATLAAIAVVLRRSGREGREGRGPGERTVVRLLVSAGFLVIAFVLVVLVPVVSYWPLLLLVVDGGVGHGLARLRERGGVAGEVREGEPGG